MLQELERKCHEAALVPGETVLVAVSGGVDSVVLLHLLWRLREPLGLELTVAHLDHQLRPESHRDAQFVESLCRSLRLPCLIERCDVARLAEERKISLEMAGRLARREFLLRAAEQDDAKLIALAHHRNDQVETFLQRLIRGSGPLGLAAMRPLEDRWWRPLLTSSRAQISAYAAEQQLAWVEDDSNRELVFLRNRLRHELLPQLRNINPRVDERLATLCGQLQDDECYWQSQVERLLPTVLSECKDGLCLDVPTLRDTVGALRLRLLRGALQQLRGDLQRLSAIHIQALDDLLCAERSQAEVDLPGCWAGRRYEQLWLCLASPERLGDYCLELSAPGALDLPCGRTLLASVGDEQLGESPRVAEFALANLTGPLWVRNWCPGDRFAPEGMDGRVRLKRYFGDRRLTFEERVRVPLVGCSERILWLAGERRSRHAPAGRSEGQILRLELV